MTIVSRLCGLAAAVSGVYLTSLAMEDLYPIVEDFPVSERFDIAGSPFLRMDYGDEGLRFVPIVDEFQLTGVNYVDSDRDGIVDFKELSGVAVSEDSLQAKLRF